MVTDETLRSAGPRYSSDGQPTHLSLPVFYKRYRVDWHHV